MPAHEELDIRPEYSAVAGRGESPSRATRAAISALQRVDAERICELGCGLLATTPYLLDAFPSVVLVDRQAQIERIGNKVAVLAEEYESLLGLMEANEFAGNDLDLDAAVVINVLHVLPIIGDRIQLLKSVARNLRDGGFLFLDGPRNETYYRTLVKTASPYRDGFVMRRDSYFTFYKNLSFTDLADYSEEAGFEVLEKITLSHRVTFLARKADG